MSKKNDDENNTEMQNHKMIELIFNEDERLRELRKIRKMKKKNSLPLSKYRSSKRSIFLAPKHRMPSMQLR